MMADVQGLIEICEKTYKVGRLSKIRSWIHKKTYCFRCIKYGHQRIRRGYSDEDVWDIDRWFYRVVIPMIDQHRRSTQGVPNKIAENYCDENGNLDDKVAMAAWDRELRKMIWLFRESDEENSLGGKQKGEVYMEKCKEQAFSMFCKYFHDLWD